jgi:hypothetical protein
LETDAFVCFDSFRYLHEKLKKVPQLDNKFVGWERNVQSKLGPRISDLGPQTHKVTGKITNLFMRFFFPLSIL